MKRREVRRALRTAAHLPVPPPSADAAARVVAQARAAFAQLPMPLSRTRSRRPLSPAARVAVVCALVLAAVIGGLSLKPPAEVDVRFGGHPPAEPRDVSPQAVPTMEAQSPAPTRTAPTEATPSPHAPGMSDPAEQRVPSPSPSPAGALPSLTAEPRESSPSPSPETPANGYAGTSPEHRMSLGARVERDGVHLGWSVFDAGEFEQYLVIRADGSMPSWPLDERSRVVARIPRDGPTNLVDSEPWTRRPVYRVVAIDEREQEVGRSRAVTAEDGAAASGPEQSPGGFPRM